MPLRLEIGLGRTLEIASGVAEASDWGDEQALWRMRGERSNSSSWSISNAIVATFDFQQNSIRNPQDRNPGISKYPSKFGFRK